jgi:hypothetical protein
MKVDIHEAQKQVCIWLSHSESDDPELQEQIRKITAAYADQKYLVAVFQSGNTDLYDNTLAMLAHNRRVAARKE